MTLLDRLIAWKQEADVADADGFMNTVYLIQDYVAHADLAAIKSDVSAAEDARSNAYQTIVSAHKAYKAILLFTKLTTDESIEFLSSERELNILKALQQSFGSLFLASRSEPKKHLDVILNSWREFLAIPPESFTNKIQAQTLYYTFYLAMNYTRIRMSGLNWSLVQLAKLFQIDIEHYIKALGVLITCLEGNMALLLDVLNSEVVLEERSINDLAFDVELEDERNQLTPAQQAMQQHFNQHYIQVLESELSLDDKLKALLLRVEQITHKVIEYRSHRMSMIEINANIKKISALFQVFKSNQEQVSGRRYFLDLRNANACAYDLLIALASKSSKRDELISNVAQQERGSLSSKALHALSAATAIAVVPARLLMPMIPRFLTNAANALLPDTLDSRAKQLLLELSDELLIDLRQRLTAVQGQIYGDLSFLFSGDDSLNALIGRESLDSIIRLIQLNTVDRRGAHIFAALSLLTTDESDNSSAFEVDIPICLDVLIPDVSEMKLELVRLIQLKVEQKKLVGITKDLDVIGHLIDTHTNNKFILPLANQQATAKRLRLEQVALSVQETIATVAGDNQALALSLNNSSSDKLIELLLTMSSESLSPQLILEPDSEDLSIQEHFNKHYLDLLQNDARDEEVKLEVLQQSLENIESGLIGLLDAKKEQQRFLLKAQQHRRLMDEFQNSAECLPFIQLMTKELSALQVHCDSAVKKIEAHARQLFPGETVIRQKLIRESEPSLSRVLSANQAALSCVKNYRSMQSTKNLLVSIGRDSDYLSTYILEHNSWWVRFTNFLARLCSIFKTDAGRMIDEAKALNKDLIACEEQCRQHIVLCNALVKNDSFLGPELLKNEEQGANEIEIVCAFEESHPFNREMLTSSLSRVSLFKSKVPERSNSSLMNGSVSP